MKLKYFIFLFYVFSSFYSGFSQTKKQLENERRKLQKEIKKVNQLLFKEIKKEKNALEDLKDINKKIKIP